MEGEREERGKEERKGQRESENTCTLKAHTVHCICSLCD